MYKCRRGGQLRSAMTRKGSGDHRMNNNVHILKTKHTLISMHPWYALKAIERSIKKN
jgi:hypothetical protein